MKRAQNKSNLSIIKDYVNGERPFIQISMANVEELKKKKEGEEWEDTQGKRWKKQGGKKVAINNVKTKVLDEIKNYYICKICNSDTRFSPKQTKKMDSKVILKTGKCYDCLIEFETLLKIKGLYESYSRHRDLQNVKSYLLDFKAKLTESIAWCSDPKNKVLTYFNDGMKKGDVEIEKIKDDSGINDKIKEDAEKDLKLVNDRLIDVEKELSEFDFNGDAIKDIENNLKAKYKDGRTSITQVIRMANQ